MALEDTEQSVNEITLGAERIAKLTSQGLTVEQAADAIFGVSDKKNLHRSPIRQSPESQERLQKTYARRLAAEGLKLPDDKTALNVSQIENAGATGFGYAQGELQEWDSPLERAAAGFKAERPKTRRKEDDKLYRKAQGQYRRKKINTAELNAIGKEAEERIKDKQKNFDFGINDFDGQFKNNRIVAMEEGPVVRRGRPNINFDANRRDPKEQKFLDTIQPEAVIEGVYDLEQIYGIQQDKRGEPLRGRDGKLQRQIPLNIYNTQNLRPGAVIIGPDGRAVNNNQGFARPFRDGPELQGPVELRLQPQFRNNVGRAAINKEGRLVRAWMTNKDGKGYYQYLIEQNLDDAVNQYGNIPNILGNAPARVNDEAIKRVQMAIEFGKVDPVEGEKLLRRLEQNAVAPELRGNRIEAEAAAAAVDRARRGAAGALTTGEVDELVAKEIRRAAPDPLKPGGTGRRDYVDVVGSNPARPVNMRTVNQVIPGLGEIQIQVPGSATGEAPTRRIVRAGGVPVVGASTIEDQVRAREAARNPAAAERIRRANIEKAEAKQLANGLIANNVRVGRIDDIGKARIGGGVLGDPLNKIMTGKYLEDLADAPGFNQIYRNRGIGAADRIKFSPRYDNGRTAFYASADNGQYQWLDRSGAALGSDFYPDFGAANTPNNSQALNAPASPDNALQWAAKRAYDNYGAQQFGDVEMAQAGAGGGGGLRQVDIQGAIDRAEQQIMKQGLGKKVFGEDGVQLRNIEQVDDAIKRVKEAKGRGKFYRKNEDGNRVYVSNPGVNTVFDKLKVPGAMQDELANALIQLELGGRAADFAAGVPMAKPEAPVVRNVNDPAKGGDRLEIAKANRDVAALFRAAGLSTDAAKPFIAKVVGQQRDPRKNVQVYKGLDPVEVRRHYEDQKLENDAKKAARAAKKGLRFIPLPMRKNTLNKIRNAQAGNVAARARYEGEYVGGNVYANPSPIGLAELKTRPEWPPKQRITEAPVPESIAPEPGASTGNQFMAAIDAGVSRAKEFATSPQYQRGRRIGYGVAGGAAALGGLASLISGEREERDQEAYQ